jgi:hypothetical protein
MYMLHACLRKAHTLQYHKIPQHGETHSGSVLKPLKICTSVPLQMLSTNDIMPSSKRTAVGAASPLEDAGILLHILSIVGPGQHLFISAVSRAWRESYSRAGSVQMPGITEDYDDIADLRTIGSLTTVYSAVFAPAASVILAHECGLAFDNKNLHRIAGRVADISVIRAVQELGLQLTDEVLIGAAEAASVPKLQWLHTQQGCLLPQGICDWAAKSGSIDLLRWLKEHGSEFEFSNCEGAAFGAHQHVLQYLHDEGCEWDDSACSGAARNGHLKVLQWLHEQGCPWDPDRSVAMQQTVAASRCYSISSSKGSSTTRTRWRVQQRRDTLLSASS